jgi:NAD(P)-dependent dehydrogenase (short-subunit alcohol dehydrogenase family)
MNLEGKIVVITGAGSGIGRATALALARLGAKVVAADLVEEWAAATAEQVRAAGSEAIAVRVDVSREEDLAQLFETTEHRFGGMDVLVNNAGVLGGPRFPDALPRHWKRAIDINVLGVAYGIHHGVPLLRRRGGGVIINTASTSGLTPHTIDPMYAATKAAVVNLTRSLSFLQEEDGIRVNCVCPALVETPLEANTGADFDEESRTDFIARRSVRRGRSRLTPEDIASAIVELIEDDSLNGVSYKVVLGQPWEKIAAPSPQPVAGTPATA